ncbi:MAG: phage tail tape measure protein, partial [Armatimonadia bacterium]
ADVGTLGAALSQSGNVAASTGLTIEETVGALAAFADNALVGSDAGTSFKSMLQRLTPQSNEAKAKMDELGISAYDAQGNFIGLAKFAGQLQTALADKSAEERNSAMATIFGADAVRAANVLYSQGEQGIRDYTAAVDDQGAAADMAAAMLNNLAGDLEELRGSMETALIKGGSGANDVLRTLTQNATALVNAIGGLPSPVVGVGLALGAMSGAALLLLPSVARVKASLTELGLTADTTRGKLALLARGAGIAAIVGLGVQAIVAKQKVDDLTGSIDDMIAALKAGEGVDFAQLKIALDDLIAQRDHLNDPTAWSLDKAGYALYTGVRALGEGLVMGNLDGIWGEIDKINQSVDQGQITWTRYLQVVNAVGREMGISTTRASALVQASGVDLSKGLITSINYVMDYAEAQASGTAASNAAATAMGVLADETATADDKLRAFTSSMSLYLDGALGMSDASIASRNAFRQLAESLTDGGITWDKYTEAGDRNRAMLNDAIRAAGDVAVAKYKETGSIEDANEAYKRSIREGMKAAGMTDKQREAVMKLIGKEGLGSLKPEYFTDVVVDGTTTAISNVMSLISYLDTLPPEKRIPIKVEWYGAGNYDPPGDGKGENGATGKIARKGRRYIVGEMGREEFIPAVDGRIVPNHEVEKWSRAERGGLDVQRVQHSRKFADSVTVQVQSAPQERAAESLPRALRRMAFLEDLNA